MFRVSSHTRLRGVNRLLAEAEAKVAAGEGEALLSQKYHGFVPISASRCLPVVEASAGWARHVCGSQPRGVNRFASLVGRDGQPRLFPPPAPRARIGGLFTPLAVNRPDDLFSSDFTDEQLAASRPHPHQR